MRARPGNWVLASSGLGLVLIGLSLALLPKDWLEGLLGFEPDGGNGAIELALVLVPLVLGSAAIATAVLRERRVPVPADEHPRGEGQGA